VQQLSARDLGAALDYLLEAGSFPDLNSYRTGILPGLLGLVHADVAGYNEVDTERGTTTVISYPHEAFFEGVEEQFARVVHQHPLVARAQVGDRASYAISDFLTERQFHRLELYQDMYRRIDAEDQIAFALPGEPLVGIALNRPRRSFTNRDHAMLELLRPHLGQAYQHARQRELARSLLAASEAALETMGTAVILLESSGRIGHATLSARRYLADYFEARDGHGDRLPAAVNDWIITPDPNRRTDSVHIDGDHGRLRITRVARADDSTWPIVLLLQEAAVQRPALAALERLGLTRRQAQVLQLVAIGEDDRRIAQELWLSTATVRKHLENIYARRGVNSRTAAAARAHAAH
jgi:DNA-binding CsgD family transcriptional regulator